MAVNLVNQKLATFDPKAAAERKDRRSLLDDYLLNPKLELPDIVGLSTDLLLAGTDTVKLNLITFQLFAIALNSWISYDFISFYRHRIQRHFYFIILPVIHMYKRRLFKKS